MSLVGRVAKKTSSANVGGLLQQLWKASHWRFIFLTSGYALFCLYALAVSAGVFWSLYGMKPRFNVPKAWKAAGSRPSSLLFFEKIIEVSPADWARAFTATTAATTAEDLAFEYVKNNILETYLIAQKIPSKLRPLRKANTLYIASACILVAWVVLTAIAVGSIDLWPTAGVSAIKSTATDNEAPSVPPNVSHNAGSSVGETRSEEQSTKGQPPTPIEQMFSSATIGERHAHATGAQSWVSSTRSQISIRPTRSSETLAC